MTFVAELLSVNSLWWKGGIFEFFTTWETESVSFAAGDRVRCLYVEQTRQVFVLERIA